MLTIKRRDEKYYKINKCVKQALICDSSFGAKALNWVKHQTSNIKSAKLNKHIV